MRREDEVMNRAPIGAQQAREDPRGVTPPAPGPVPEQRLDLGKGARRGLSTDPQDAIVEAAGARGEVASQQRRAVMPRGRRRRGDQEHMGSRRGDPSDEPWRVHARGVPSTPVARAPQTASSRARTSASCKVASSSRKVTDQAIDLRPSGTPAPRYTDWKVTSRTREG